MRVRAVVAMVWVLLVAPGCARKGFVKPGASTQDYYSEYTDCQREIGYEGWCMGVGCLVAKGELDSRIKSCLLAKGWTVEAGGYRP